MDKLTLGEIVREYNWDWCGLVSTIAKESWKYEQQGGELLFGEEFPLRHKLRQEDYSVEEFRKVARKYSGEARETCELMVEVMKSGKYEFLFVPELREHKPFELLLEEEKFEWLYEHFHGNEKAYSRIVPKLVEADPQLAAKLGIKHRDAYLVQLALKQSSSPRWIEAVYLLAEQVDPGFVEMLNIGDLSAVDDYLEEAKRIMHKLGCHISSIYDELERNKRRGKIRACKEAVRIIKELSKKVSQEYGLKLPLNVTLSKPKGNYASIGYIPEELEDDTGDFAAASA